MKYEELYVAYLVYFNRDRDYFECHEVLEELWLKLDKDPLYKGLLQVAVGLYHFRNGNIRGGQLMIQGAYDKLKPYSAHTLGIDMGLLQQQLLDYKTRLERYEQFPFDYEDLTIDIVDPELKQAVEHASLAIKPNIPQRRGPQRPTKKH